MDVWYWINRNMNPFATYADLDGLNILEMVKNTVYPVEPPTAGYMERVD